jgi:ParB family transcriptional regulator, chromosome partitioning protein
MSEMTLAIVPLDRVCIGARLRDLNEDQVAVLAESIAHIGLLNPITVWAPPVVEDGLAVPQYSVVAGAHRLEACKRLGLAEIPAHIVALPELKRQLAECDENLAGPTLTKAERALFTRHRKAIYEALHPETRQHVAGAHAANAAMGNASAKLAPAFTADTAAKTGQSERAVQRDVTRGERIAEDVLKVVQGTDFDLGNNLDALAKLPVEQQRKVAEFVHNKDLIPFRTCYVVSTLSFQPTFMLVGCHWCSSRLWHNTTMDSRPDAGAWRGSANRAKELR